MDFPVDILATVNPESLEQSAKDYMSKLLCRNSEIHEYLTIPGSKKIEIGLCNVSFVPLYGVDIKQKVLALFSPEEPFKAVGLYLLDQWWAAEDILKTADSSRTGLIKVKTPGERIVLYVLNRIIYRTKEMARDDVAFLCHGEDEIGKILWKNGEAVGFYSVKPEGRLCNSFLTQRYQLPVMDTVFVRKHHRGNGHGLQMLEDFVNSFKTDCMGLKYPLSPAMYKVCKRYLSLYPQDTKLLWEIEGVGSPFQRTQVARKLQAMDLKGNQHFTEKFEYTDFDAEDCDIPMEVGVTQVRETMMEYSEVVEEVVKIKITKAVQDTPVTTCCRRSNLKRRKLGADTEETTEKIFRVEDIEPDVQCAEDYLVHEDGTLSSNSKEFEIKDTMETMTRDVISMSEITHLHCEEQNKLTRKPTHQSETEKEQVVEILPVVETQSLKGNEDVQILKAFEATVVPVGLQPLEHQQVVEVENVQMSLETEEVKSKAVENKYNVNKDIALDEREPSEDIIESKQDQTDMEESTNKADVENKVGMGKESVVENIVDDSEQVEIEKREPGGLEVSLVEREQSEQVKGKDTVDETDTAQECLCEKEQEMEDSENVNEAEKENERKVSEPSAAEHDEEREGEPASETVPEEIIHSTEEASSTLKMQKVAVVLVDLEKVFTTHDASEDAKGTLQPESTEDREEKEANGLNQKDEPTEKEQEVELTENENVTVEVKNKIENSSIEETEEMTETEEKVIRTDVDRVSELTTDENSMEEFQEEKTLKETKAVQDTPDEIKNKDIIESREDDEGVKSDNQSELSEEEEDKTNFVTPLRHSRRQKRQLAERELTKSILRRSASKPTAINLQVQTKQDVDCHEIVMLSMEKVLESHTGTAVEEVLNESALNDVVEEERNVDEEHLEEITDYQNFMDVENKTEDGSQDDENKMDTKLRVEDQEKVTSAEELGETTKDKENLAVVHVHDAEDVRAAETGVKGVSPEPSSAEAVEEQQEEPTSERMPTEDDNNTEEATSSLKLQNFVVELDNKVPPEHESDDSEMDKGISQEEGVVQELHKPKSTDHRNEGEDEVNQTEDEAEPSEKVQMENEHEQTEEVKDETMEIEENIMSKVEDKFPESAFTAEKQKDKAQDKEPMKQTTSNQDLRGEKPIIQDDIESSEDNEGLKSDDQIELSEEEQDKMRCVTPLRRSRRLKHQVAESELRKRVLRSATKAAKVTSETRDVLPQVEKKEPVDDPEGLESHTEIAVKENIESVITSTEVEIEVERKTPRQSAAEPVEEHEEEPPSEIGPTVDGNTEEATSGLKLQKGAVVLVGFDKDSTTQSDAGEDDKGTLQPQEEVDLECDDAESLSEHTEKEQRGEMTENEVRYCSTEETDEKVESKEGVILNDEDGVPASAVSDEENMEEIQEETDAAQQIQAEEPKSLHVLESSEEDEGERSDVPINQDEEEEEEEASSVNQLRRSRRLKDQGAENDLRKSVLRRSARLTDKATPQKRQQIKAMMLEEPEQLDESKNDEMDIVLGSEIALGEHMESETVHVLAEGDPEIMISAVQSTGEEGNNLEKDEAEADDRKNIKKVKISHGSEGEENIICEDVTEQDKVAPEDIIRGEAEQICTSGEKSDVDIEVVKEVEDKVRVEGAAEMAHGEDCEKVVETTSALTLQEASVVLVDVSKVPPNPRDDCSSASESAREEMSNRLEMSEQAVDMSEEVKEDSQTEVFKGENVEIESVNPLEGAPADLNTGAMGTVEEGSNVVMSNLDDDTSKLEEEKLSDEGKVDKESKSEQFTLQDPILTQDSVLRECSETTCVHDVMDIRNTEVVKVNISVEEKEEVLATEWALDLDRENVVESTSMVKLHKAAVVLVDFQRPTAGNGTDRNETTQLQEVALLTAEEKASVEMARTEPVTERKEEVVVDLGTDNTLVMNDKQEDRDIHAEEGVKVDLKEVEDIILKEKSTSTELDPNKTLKEYQESTTPAQGESVQESSQDEEMSVNTSRNVRCRTLPVKATPEKNIYKEMQINEESADEEAETVFIRHLRRRTITITPRKRSKHLTDTRAAEPEIEAHVSQVCHEISLPVSGQSTEEARSAVEETSSKYDSEEIPTVSEAVRKDQQQDEYIPANYAEKVEEVSDGGKHIVKETDREIQVEGDLPDENQENEEPDENQENEEPDELNQEQVRSVNSEQESAQQEEMLREETFEETLNKKVEEEHLEEVRDGTLNISITEADPDQSEEHVGVEKRALRKRTIAVRAASVRKSKRLRKHDQGDNNGQTLVWADMEDAPEDPTVMEMSENETTDRGKSQELEDTNTTCGEISHKEEKQENAEGEETSGDANNSQEIIVTVDVNVSEEDADANLVAEEEKGEENREEQSEMEEIMESANSSGKADKVAGEPVQFERNEKNAEGMTEASVTVDENFTLELEEKINSSDAECNQVVEETKASFQESEKQIADSEEESGVTAERISRGRKPATPEQTSAGRSRIFLQNSQSKMEDKSETEEVKEVTGEEEKKLQYKKRKTVVELTPRRSKRLAKAEIV